MDSDGRKRTTLEATYCRSVSVIFVLCGSSVLVRNIRLLVAHLLRERSFKSSACMLCFVSKISVRVLIHSNLIALMLSVVFITKQRTKELVGRLNNFRMIVFTIDVLV